MKNIKFTFRNGFHEPIIETFPFDDDATEEEIEYEFNDWYENELDRAGITSHWEEVTE